MDNRSNSREIWATYFRTQDRIIEQAKDASEQAEKRRADAERMYQNWDLLNSFSDDAISIFNTNLPDSSSVLGLAFDLRLLKYVNMERYGSDPVYAWLVSEHNDCCAVLREEYFVDTAQQTKELSAMVYKIHDRTMTQNEYEHYLALARSSVPECSQLHIT
jgi:hypothetical protein